MAANAMFSGRDGFHAVGVETVLVMSVAPVSGPALLSGCPQNAGQPCAAVAFDFNGQAQQRLFKQQFSQKGTDMSLYFFLMWYSQNTRDSFFNMTKALPLF